MRLSKDKNYTISLHPGFYEFVGFNRDNERYVFRNIEYKDYYVELAREDLGIRVKEY